ncbi:MAG: DUF58 domain-containing protein [Saprospiraceae bacterium]|nr:DUF58 domain-containing protein [Saprospiraceae bacterium]
MKQLYLTDRFFWLMGGLVICFALSFAVPEVFPLIQLLLLASFIVVWVDVFLLFNKNTMVGCARKLPNVFSLNDPNQVKIDLQNKANISLFISVIDELPVQFQVRDFLHKTSLAKGTSYQFSYDLVPKERGEYHFGAVNLFLSSRIGLVERRIQQTESMSVPVYPSIIQMKQYELQAFAKISHFQGIKKIRRIGHSYEFEQIKNYVRGDDYRSINWKASSRRATLMVNQYEDERAQQVYSVIDKSRAMRMPFNGLSLMDYAINTTLAFSNIALKKYDRAGLITFSDKIGTSLKADSKSTQLNKILLSLYKEKERVLEANYELLYYATRKLISGRSMIMLYTNFESMYALERVLPILRKINNAHLLVVVFFENTEIRDFVNQQVNTLEDIYHQTIARKFLHEKNQMVQTLRQYGIQAVLTAPEDLSINTINKYLELKSRGLI